MENKEIVLVLLIFFIIGLYGFISYDHKAKYYETQKKHIESVEFNF